MQTLVSDEDKQMPVLDISYPMVRRGERGSRQQRKKKGKKGQIPPKGGTSHGMVKKGIKTKDAIRQKCPKGFSELPHYAFDQNIKKKISRNEAR